MQARSNYWNAVIYYLLWQGDMTWLVTMKELAKATLGYDVISFHPPILHLTKQKPG